MKHKLIIICIILLVVGGVAYLFWQVHKTLRGSDGPVQNSTITPVSNNSDIIDLSLVQDQVITSPLTITGKAKGSWYFEASFPIWLLDANGKELARAPAQSQSEWMTEDFVPFKLTLNFAKPSTATGTLIFHNDNESDRRDLDKEFKLPIKF